MQIEIAWRTASLAWEMLLMADMVNHFHCCVYSALVSNSWMSMIQCQKLQKWKRLCNSARFTIQGSTSGWQSTRLLQPQFLSAIARVLFVCIVRHPYDLGGVHHEAGRTRFLKVHLDHVGCCADDVLPLLILDEVEVVERGDDVVRPDGCHGGQVLDGDGALMAGQHAAVRSLAQVGQRTLGRADLGPARGSLEGAFSTPTRASREIALQCMHAAHASPDEGTDMLRNQGPILTLPSIFDSSYEKAMRNLPYPLRWYGGSDRMHARL